MINNTVLSLWIFMVISFQICEALLKKPQKYLLGCSGMPVRKVRSCHKKQLNNPGSDYLLKSFPVISFKYKFVRNYKI